MFKNRGEKQHQWKNEEGVTSLKKECCEDTEEGQHLRKLEEDLWCIKSRPDRDTDGTGTPLIFICSFW